MLLRWKLEKFLEMKKKRLENRKWGDNKIAPSPVDILKKIYNRSGTF